MSTFKASWRVQQRNSVPIFIHYVPPISTPATAAAVAAPAPVRQPTEEEVSVSLPSPALLSLPELPIAGSSSLTGTKRSAESCDTDTEDTAERPPAQKLRLADPEEEEEEEEEANSPPTRAERAHVGAQQELLSASQPEKDHMPRESLDRDCVCENNPELSQLFQEVAAQKPEELPRREDVLTILAAVLRRANVVGRKLSDLDGVTPPVRVRIGISQHSGCVEAQGEGSSSRIPLLLDDLRVAESLTCDRGRWHPSAGETLITATGAAPVWESRVAPRNADEAGLLLSIPGHLLGEGTKIRKSGIGVPNDADRWCLSLKDEWVAQALARGHIWYAALSDPVTGLSVTCLRGRYLWFVWPGSPNNLLKFAERWGFNPSLESTLGLISTSDDMSVLVLETDQTAVLPPGSIYCSIALTDVLAYMNLGVLFYKYTDAPFATKTVQALQWILLAKPCPLLDIVAQNIRRTLAEAHHNLASYVSEVTAQVEENTDQEWAEDNRRFLQFYTPLYDAVHFALAALGDMPSRTQK